MALNEVITSLDIEIARLRDAPDMDIRRAALAATLHNLYRLRCYRVGAPGSGEPAAFYARAALSHEGMVAEGISLVRGDLTHYPTRDIAPEPQQIYPSDRLFPSENLFPGEQLVWLYASEMTTHDLPESQPRFTYYGRYVAGQPVLPTLVEARNFLVNDPGPCL